MRHHTAGHLDKARSLYKQVLEAVPTHPDAFHLLGVLALQSGDPQTAVRLIRKAIGHLDNKADYHANLGLALSALGQPETAMAAYERALQLDPAHANAHYNLGSTQRMQGRLPEAIASLERSLALDPTASEVRANLAALYLQHNEPERALTQCVVCLETNPRDRLAIAYKAVALQSMKDWEQSRFLLDLDVLVSTRTIEVPAGFDTLASFNLALAQHIQRHPSLGSEQSAKATRNGLQTGDLLTAPKGPFANFETLVNRAVTQYLENLPADERHPYLAGHPKTWRLDVWGVVLACAGHQTAHMHAGGWVSGVYYVDLPTAVDEQGPEGWIEFGRPPEELGTVCDSEVRKIRPEAGKLILFPSYLFHQTVPFTSNEPRISVAFDAIPLEFG